MISIVIPTLNEERALPELLVDLEQALNRSSVSCEVIVVDGGSTDRTKELAAEFAFVKLQLSPAGRASQMNAGADAATGSLLCFLHADSQLSRTFFDSLVDMLALIQQKDSKELWGRFDIALSSTNWKFRIIEWLINLRSRISGIATGDQAIFVSRSLFDRIDGFAEIPLMEDVDLSRRLKDICSPHCLKTQVQTSSRRWEENGVIKTVLLMWGLRFAYWLGVSPNELALYYGKKP